MGRQRKREMQENATPAEQQMSEGGTGIRRLYGDAGVSPRQTICERSATVRASGLYPAGSGFESLRSYHIQD